MSLRLALLITLATLTSSAFAGTEVVYMKPIPNLFDQDKVISYLDQPQFDSYQIVGIQFNKIDTLVGQKPGCQYSGLDNDGSCLPHTVYSGKTEVVQVLVQYKKKDPQAGFAPSFEDNAGPKDTEIVTFNIKADDFSDQEIQEIKATKKLFGGYNNLKNLELARKMFQTDKRLVNPYKQVEDTEKSEFCSFDPDWASYANNCTVNIVYKTIYAPDHFLKLKKN